MEKLYDYYLIPFYNDNVSWYETAMFLGEEGEITPLFPIKKLHDVCSYGQDIIYEEEKDYTITEVGTIKRLKGSKIPFMEFDEYYLSSQDGPIVISINNDKVTDERKKNKFISYGECSTFTSKQFCFTYEHEGKWDDIRPTNQSSKLSKFIDKLHNKEKPTILFYGDSITVGCNASGTEYGGNTAPHMESWPVLVTKALKEAYNAEINYVNTAVGGTETSWGLENIEERVNKYNPDLVFIGFGMNDGMLDPKEFKSRILKMIEKVQNHNPNVEFVLISTTIPNPETTWYLNQYKYIDVLKEINVPNVALVDMTSTHLALLKRKEFKDMTGNNINHPNDYLIRIYAHMILGTFLGD